MIIVDDGRYLRLDGADRFKARLLMMPGFSKWKDDKFYCEPTRANIEWLEKEFSAALWQTSRLKDIQDLRKVELESLNQQHAQKPDDYDFKTEPFQHQLDAFMRSRDMTWFGYFMEMGTGKTKVLIDNAAYLWHHNLIDAMIVLAPNGVHRQFIHEQVPTHMPADVDIDSLIYYSGGNKEYQMRKRHFLKPNLQKLRILSMNVEALSHTSGLNYVIEFLKSIGSPGTERPILCAVDESTRIKNANAKRSVNVCKVGNCCKYRRILSGAPVTKGVEDLFGQLKFLSSKVLGFSSFYTFRNRYCIVEKMETKAGKDYSVISGYQHIDELHKKLAPYVHRVKKEECLDLPPKIYMKREVPLNEQQRDMYRQLRKEMLLEFENMTLTATMAAVRLTKLQQIVCGHIRFTDQQKLIQIPNVPRFDVVEEVIDEVKDQVIIWARFTPDIDQLCERLSKYGVSRYDGQVPQALRQQSIDDFRSQRNQIFVGQPASAGIGLNLTGPSNVIYFSNSFDAEHRWQSEDRNHRAGTTRSVTYLDLVSPNTVDSYILAALARKKDVASLSIDELRNFLEEDV